MSNSRSQTNANKKTKRVTARFIEADYEEIQTKASSSKLTVAEYVAYCTLRRELLPPPTPDQIFIYKELGLVRDTIIAIRNTITSCKTKETTVAELITQIMPHLDTAENHVCNVGIEIMGLGKMLEKETTSSDEAPETLSCG